MILLRRTPDLDPLPLLKATRIVPAFGFLHLLRTMSFIAAGHVVVDNETTDRFIFVAAIDVATATVKTVWRDYTPVELGGGEHGGLRAWAP